MHVTILIKYLHNYKSNIIYENKATNLIEAAICSELGACKSNYRLLIKLKNKFLRHVYLLNDIITRVYLTHVQFIPNKMFKCLN